MAFLECLFHDADHGTFHLIGQIEWYFFNVEGNRIPEHLDGIKLPGSVFLLSLEFVFNCRLHVLILL